jgi:ubiquinone/menaquinone biosynthesis C-methylase UbiE
MSNPTYNRIGLNYTNFRQADPRIGAAIWKALGDARSVVNVGAGAGSYEPSDREVVAVEPSPVMIAQRSPDAAPALEGVAESLPLDDKSVDAAMGVLTIHHWPDLEAGLAEMRRVARRRIVLLTIDTKKNSEIWTLSEYFPEAMALERELMPSLESLESSLPRATFEAVPAPSRCRDEFTSALWDQPERFLDPDLLRGSSLWHHLSPATIERGQERLRADLASGAWDERHGHLRTLPELDIGLRLVCEEL